MTTDLTTYTVNPDPIEIPTPTEGEYQLREFFSAPQNLGDLDSPVVEAGEPIPAQPVSTYRKRVRTTPAAAPGPDGLWPVYLDADGAPVDPNVVLHALLDGEAVLVGDPKFVEAHLEHLRRNALVPSDELKPFRRVLRAGWERGLKQALRANAIPTDAGETLSMSQMEAIFGSRRDHVLRWVNDRRIPAPFQLPKPGDGVTGYLWSTEQVRQWLKQLRAAAETRAHNESIYADSRARLAGKRAHHDRLAERMAVR